MRDHHLHTLILGVGFGLGGCVSANEATLPDGDPGGTSAAAAGRQGTGAVGGAGATGHSGSGGTTALAGTGGSTGGSTAGTSALGGGGSGSGGRAGGPSGGASATAGSGSGGTPGMSSGGTSATAGRSSIGGNSSVGGAAGAGAAGAAGASADPPCPTPTPRTGGKQYCSPPSNGTASGNYTYDLWSDSKGTGCITVYGVDAAFKANWMNVGDWIARVGLSFDRSKTYDQLGTFSADFAYTMTGITTGGFGNVGIYGWTVSPLHEFYIEENWLGKPPNFTKVASFTIEGEGTYEVMTNMQKDQPNITGMNQDFVQYWSVRSTPRQCGHISLSKHFDEWASLGLTMGKMEEARFSVEGQNNSGTIDFTTATLVVTK